jgi:hypothetical protein
VGGLVVGIHTYNGFGAVAADPASEVVASAADGPAGGTKDGEDRADDQQDDPEGPENRDLQEESHDQQDKAENDHDGLLGGEAVRDTREG